MIRRASLSAILLVHLVAWWGVRVSSSRMPFMHAAVPDSPAFWTVRLLRAALTIAIVLGWAGLSRVPLRDLGLSGARMGRNFLAFVAFEAVLFIVVGMARGGLIAPHPMPPETRVLAAATGLLDVLAQQLPTFGLLQGAGAQALGSRPAFVLALLTFVLAHLIFASLPVVAVALVMGLVAGVLLWRTGNLGASLGAHGGFYLMRSILGWGA